MRHILVTGAQGLVGSHLVERLARGDRVYALGRSGVESASANVVPIAADLSKPLDPSILPDRLDAVIYLAQSNRFRDFPDGAADMFQVNVAQPMALIEHARRAGATNFVYASTGSVYAPGDAIVTEASATPADGFYASSKLAAEQLLRNYSSLLSVTLLRIFFAYGPGQKTDMFLPRLAAGIRQGLPVSLQGEEGIRFQPLHAADAASAVESALRLEDSQVINVAGPEVHSLREVAGIIGGRTGREPVFQIDRSRSPRHLVADTSRMESLLGRARIGFRDGAADL